MNISLFIDINTMGNEYVNCVYGDAIKQGHVIFKKAYGYVGRNGKLKEDLKKNGIYIMENDAFKNRTSGELICDIFEACKEKTDNIIYLATGDAYLQPVVRSLVAKGCHVYVAAPKEVSEDYVQTATRFRFLEVLMGENTGLHVTPVEEIAKQVHDIVIADKARGRVTDAENVFTKLCDKYHEFDIKNYGYTHFETFVGEQVKGVRLETDEDRILIKKIDDRKDVERFIYNFLSKRENKVEDMAEIFEALDTEYPGFNMHSYGYSTEFGFILSFPKLEILGNKGVKLKQTFKLSGNPDKN